MTTSTQCNDCGRYRGLGQCAAFPDAIPGDIFDGEFDHAEPHDGDHGLQFVARKKDERENFKLRFPVLPND